MSVLSVSMIIVCILSFLYSIAARLMMIYLLARYGYVMNGGGSKTSFFDIVILMNTPKYQRSKRWMSSRDGRLEFHAGLNREDKGYGAIKFLSDTSLASVVLCIACFTALLIISAID